ncbi:MAG: tetratricopeptide repeat protein [Bryobacteraceae bacterium]|nr:tetratricopeptide repeat protein [Bryobacteraceae bacterium]
MRLLFVLKMMAMAAAPVVPLVAADTSRERIEAGVRAQKAGDLKTASAAYREVLEKDPLLTRVRHLLGVSELQAGNIGEGIRQLEIVRRENPSNRQAIYTLLSTYIATGMAAPAGKIMESNLRGDLSAAGRFMRGSYAMAQGEYDVSIRELRQARKLDARLPGVSSQLGIAYCFANRLEEALPVLESALRENPSDGNAAAFLGWLYKDRDRNPEAAALLEQTVRARPEDHGALFLLAQLTQSRGDSVKAVALLEQIIAREPGHRAAHVLLARWYQQLDRANDAARERAVVERLNLELQASQPKVD